MSTSTPTEAPHYTINEATKVLLFAAARIPACASLMNLELVEEGEKELLRYHKRPCLYLTAKGSDKMHLSFDPDGLAKMLGKCSSGEFHCICFLLCVWNDNYARQQGWTFDLFKALNSLDSENRDAIAEFLQNPTWP